VVALALLPVVVAPKKNHDSVTTERKATGQQRLICRIY